MTSTATAPALRSRRFRQEREGDWLALERLLGRIEKNGARRMSDDDLLAIPVLYRAALSSLSLARSISLDRALLEYLESLCTRAYFVVYGVRGRLGARVLAFFSTAWPAAVRALWRETLVAVALLALGAAAGYLLVQADPEWFYSFVPRGLAEGREPAATAASLKAALYAAQDRNFYAPFATFLFTHNAEVALLSFALGFAFGAPTVALQLMNGLVLGAMVQVYASHGLAFQLGGWLVIHGVTELLALTLAAATGLRLGLAVVFPGAATRLDALKAAGLEVGPVMIGVIIMLFVAGALEGVGRQAVTADPARYAIAAVSAVVWLAYFCLPGGKPRR